MFGIPIQYSDIKRLKRFGSCWKSSMMGNSEEKQIGLYPCQFKTALWYCGQIRNVLAKHGINFLNL